MAAPVRSEMAPPPTMKLDKPAEPSAGVAHAPSAGLKGWLPLLVAVVAGPLLTWATVELALVPRLKAKFPAVGSTTAAPASGTEAAGAESRAANSSYEFSSVIVNLAGTMGTRYLKTSFVVVGDPASAVDVKQVFTENHPKLYDTTLNVLSSLTLADLEEAGAKNVIREKLVTAYNQALGKRIAEQVYFSDFVVQ